jgi:hypothetical protein
VGLVFSISNFFINKIALANIWMSFSCSNLALDCATDKYCLKKLSWNCPKVFHKIVPKIDQNIDHEIVHKTYLASIVQSCQYTVCKYSSTATQTNQNIRLDFFDDLW